MISARIQRDACDRHILVPGFELRPRAGLPMGAGKFARESVVFSDPYVMLGEGWTTAGPDGAVRVYCADHAEEATA